MPQLGRTMVVKRRTTFKIGIVVGAAVMYLLDPENGQERRRRLRDRLVAAPRAIADFVATMKGEVDEASEVLAEVADDMSERLPDRSSSDGDNGSGASQARESAQLP